jgi:hypothetical protein
MEFSSKQENVIIIYKTYTPKMAEYNKKYYQANKDKILEKRRERYGTDPDLKAKKAQYQTTYMERVKNDPKKLEQAKQYQKEYYQKTKLTK